MKLSIYIPGKLASVSKYIIEIIFTQFWDVEVEMLEHSFDYYSIIDSESGNELNLPASFILQEVDAWNEQREPSNWGLRYKQFQQNDAFPVLFDQSKLDIEFNCEIDFFGTVFFLLNRYHEQVEQIEKDNHGRIIASQTFLIRENLLDKPLADIYIQAFATLITQEFGYQPTIKSTFSILPSHDVDRPFEYLYYTKSYLVKRILGDVVNRKSISDAKNRLAKYQAVKKGNITADPYNTFDWIMGSSEKHGRTSYFHFIAENTNPIYDQDYKLKDSQIRSLFTQIHERGHQIGLHPSYNSTIQPDQITKEFERLKHATDELGIKPTIWKSRNHYLRWNESAIMELEKAGINVDQTLGFADKPGFRCGTSHSFPAFNNKEMKSSSVIIEPLILMEVSLFNTNYLGIVDMGEAWNLVSSLKAECEKYNGNFTVLWHNNNLVASEMQEFYNSCIQ